MRRWIRSTSQLANGERVQARAAVIATGARYRRLDVPGLDAFEGGAVHYWASPLEAKLCARQEVALVGGGNSAGQAVVFLAGHAGKVDLAGPEAARRDDVGTIWSSGSSGLANVEVVTGVEVSALEGEDGMLEAIGWRDLASGEETRRPIAPALLLHRRRSQYRLAGGVGARSSTSAASS